MIDHVALRVKDLAASKRFYEASLAPLGYRLLYESEEYGMLAFGSEHPQFWAIAGPTTERAHVALIAPSRAAVDDYYSAAMAAGGRDNGAPGLRPHYSPTYYAAFVYDPDGNNIEAVCHAPEA